MKNKLKLVPVLFLESFLLLLLRTYLVAWKMVANTRMIPVAGSLLWGLITVSCGFILGVIESAKVQLLINWEGIY